MIRSAALVALFVASASVRGETAEQQLTAGINQPGLSVVHLWAPWCSNCQAELKSGGWSEMVKKNPNVRFYFVSVWNGGEDGRPMLEKFGLLNQPNVTVLADPGPRGQDHIKHFLGLPLSWIPSTWIYQAGELRFAFNYGEMRFPVLQQLLADSESSWSHKADNTAGN
ncbi:MAG: TlpA family protein disulfide reductase [Chthoniobacterales bacterium]